VFAVYLGVLAIGLSFSGKVRLLLFIVFIVSSANCPQEYRHILPLPPLFVLTGRLRRTWTKVAGGSRWLRVSPLAGAVLLAHAHFPATWPAGIASFQAPCGIILLNSGAGNRRRPGHLEALT
jgi:hypothetical protein